MAHTRKQKGKRGTEDEQTTSDKADAGGCLSQDDIDRPRRRLHDALSFWMICQEKACKRARACRGDTYACARRHQPLVPQEIKVWLKKAIELRLDGLSPEEAARGAVEFVAAYEARRAEIEARFAAARGDGPDASSQKTDADGNAAEAVATPHRDAASPRVQVL